MPGYVVSRATELLNRNYKPVNGSSVLLLGVTYKKDTADLRETPATSVARQLRRAGAKVAYCDPHVTEWFVDGWRVEAGGRIADAVQRRTWSSCCRRTAPTTRTRSAATPGCCSTPAA
jgi:UDP-N-acetyl-D-mannosaminuronate dehydrogenase